MYFTEDEVKALIASGKVRVKGYKTEQKKSNKNKYNNTKVEVDGIKFDSQFEAERYGILKLLEKAGAIKDLKLQVPYELIPAFERNGKKIRKTVYKADFVYIDAKSNKKIVEDTKGYVTKEYALKKKLLLYLYPNIDFREIKKSKDK